jgi:hypothetical protein
MSDLAPDAPDQYTVQKGDTLWGIASKFLKDPWRWPQIWEMNRDQIKNPHWIYPGNVVRLDKSGANPSLSIDGGAGGPGGASGGTEAQAQANVIKVDPRIRVEPLAEAVPSIPGTAIGPFLIQPLVIEANGLDNAPTIVATSESRVVVGAGDIAYVDRVGSDSGVNWQVFRAGEALHDPETNEILGYEAKYVGDARVRRFGNPTTIEITKARKEINKGDRLAPARETSFPNYVPHAPDKPIRGAIMSVDSGVSEFGQYQIVTLNRGRARRAGSGPRARELPPRRGPDLERRAHRNVVLALRSNVQLGRGRDETCLTGSGSAQGAALRQPVEREWRGSRRQLAQVARRAQRPDLCLPRLREDVLWPHRARHEPHRTGRRGDDALTRRSPG